MDGREGRNKGRGRGEGREKGNGEGRGKGGSWGIAPWLLEVDAPVNSPYKYLVRLQCVNANDDEGRSMLILSISS